MSHAGLSNVLVFDADLLKMYYVSLNLSFCLKTEIEEAFPSMHLQHGCISPCSIKINKLEPSGPKTRGLVSICFSPRLIGIL